MERTLNKYVYSGLRYIRRDHWYGRALSVIYVVQTSINCRNQKLLLPSDSDPCRLSSESSTLSLSSAARHIDFHLLRRIYVAFVAYSIALSLHKLKSQKIQLGVKSRSQPTRIANKMTLSLSSEHLARSLTDRENTQEKELRRSPIGKRMSSAYIGVKR